MRYHCGKRALAHAGDGGLVLRRTIVLGSGPPLDACEKRSLADRGCRCQADCGRGSELSV